MYPARDIIDLLQARASSGRNAFRIAETVFTRIIVVLRRDPRFAGLSLFELELLLADEYREAEKTLFMQMRDRIHLDDAEDAVRCYLPEDS
jgi:hypothetical protein